MICPKCGSEVLNPEITGFCAICNYPFFSNSSPSDPASITSGKIAWEQMEKIGFVKSLLDTLKKSIGAPRIFFGQLSESNNSFMAWLYALVLGSTGSVFTFLWTYFFISPLLAFIPGLEDYTGSNDISLTGLVFSPVIITVKLAFEAVYFQFLFFLTGSKRKDIKATFRIICYTQSAAILNCIPVLGSIISPFWSLYLLAVGFNKIHGMSMLKAFTIILLPLVILFAVFLIAAVLFIGTGMIFQGTLKDLLNFIR